MELTSRRKVLLALNHEEPDRIPIVFGGDGATSMLEPAYEDLKRYLGVRSRTSLFSRPMRYARIDDDVMVLFQADVRSLECSVSAQYATVNHQDGPFTDYWGNVYQMPAQEGLYCTKSGPPLQRARTTRHTDGHARSDPESLLDLGGLAAKARRLHR